jgi:uncharacterized protein
MKKVLLLLLIILVSAGPVFCGEFEDTLKMAEQGDADAQYGLGSIYYLGDGVPQDYKKAVYWLTKAAEQGHYEAQYNLGVMYHEGKVVVQDNKQAVYWYKKAAEQGYTLAQFNLGLSYYEGKVVVRDYKQAVYWYKKAAEQGYAKAQSKLGLMYDRGEGVSQDYKQAAYWYKMAAEQGQVYAQRNLGLSYYHGHGVSQNFMMAYVWSNLAATKGYENAIKDRDIIAKQLTPHQLSEAQDLAAQIQYKIDNSGKEESSSVAMPTPSPNYRTPTSKSDVEVRWVQQTLKNLGYDPGPVDGVMGARTRGAIIAFQTDIGVAPTGVIDEVLVAQLRLVSKIDRARPTADTEKMVSGTGFLITTDGYIVTCHHVVEGAARIEIYVGDKMYPASLVQEDPNSDLAILKVNGSSFPALAFSPHRSAKMGQDVFTVGFPNPGLQGISAKYTKGTVSSLTGFKDDLRLYQISVPIQPGNSGGSLLDEYGNILGVVIATLSAKKTFEISGSLPQNVNYAVKSLYAQAMIDTLPGLAGKLLAPSKSQSGAIENAQNSTVMVICYD